MAAPNPSEFRPFVPAEERPAELTVSAVLFGTAMGLIFAASSLYLVLKVGMTVSASIPVAVLAVTLLRPFGKTILENNIVQTAGSAGESIAFGVGVTMPALLMLGFDMDLGRVMIVSLLGGILGILAMIPLRRAFIVKMHGRPGQPGTLLYPEGVAAAQVLISGEKGGSAGYTVFLGFGIAFAHKFATLGFQALKETVAVPITAINKAAVFATDMASELLGVGYIIGYRTSAVMMAGAVLGYLVIIPIVYFIGVNAPTIIPPSTEKLIKDMSIGELRNSYLLYIGAGCVATAGILSMLKTLPMIFRSISGGLTSGSGSSDGAERKRTDNDLSMSVVLFGSLGLLALLAAFLMPQVGLVKAVLGSLLVLLFGFLFVTVSARLTGEIGSSSNPISGMTVATLLLTCLIFVAFGMTSPTERVLALSIAGVVCIAASNGGTTAQSLKTGFLVGGTPKSMQYAILFGALISGLVIGGTLLMLNASGTVYSKDAAYLPRDPQTQKTLVLTDAERAKLNQEDTYEGKKYLVFDPRQEIFSKAAGDRPALFKAPEGVAPEGRFLVDPSSGEIAYLKDPLVGGKIKEMDGKELRRLDAPKTKVMQIIIDGVLSRKLNWSLVLIGSMIALTLELCGISALAFAVGVYVPIQFSVPIFIGGLIRAAVDKYLTGSIKLPRRPDESESEHAARLEIETIKRTETSPGVLLASGYIAGGSIAGVLAAFLEFDIAKSFKEQIDFSKAVAALGTTNDWIAIGAFSGLIILLYLFGRGLLFKTEEADA
ncbi:MAG: oligopeptide transporter, OPT family [Gemmataceae bacterium]|nr:oligopeptide transporter, OPT family [Gemmataceae bacterium]